MELSYKGGVSELKSMPGGGPAGTTLGLLMFVILVNETADPGLATNWGITLSQPIRDRKPLKMTHGKMIDDASIAESVHMDSKLTTQPEDYWI